MSFNVNNLKLLFFWSSVVFIFLPSKNTFFYTLVGQFYPILRGWAHADEHHGRMC